MQITSTTSTAAPLRLVQSQFSSLLPPIKARVSAAVHGLVGTAMAKQLGFESIKASFRRDGVDTIPEDIRVGTIATIFVHGLMDDEQSFVSEGWCTIAEESGSTAITFRHPSGDAIPANGSRLANLIDRLLANNVQLQQINLVGFSMGGLVCRSALNYAQTHHQDWLYKVQHLVLMGTPLKGADLERIVSYATSILGALPMFRPWYLRPVIRSASSGKGVIVSELVHFLSAVVPGIVPEIIKGIFEQRSSGVRDLRHGRYRWEDKGLPGSGESFLPGIQVWSIAAILNRKYTEEPQFWHFDGMVSLDSAWNLGEESLHIAPSHRMVVPRTSHFRFLFSRKSRAFLTDILTT